MSEIRTVAVLGAGTMGHGIAQVSAAAGCDVRMFFSHPFPAGYVPILKGKIFSVRTIG